MLFDLIILTVQVCNYFGLQFMKNCRSFIACCEMKQMQEIY